MVDWMDPDEFTQLNGAEAPQYAAAGRAGFPPNRPFSSVREMASVRGLQRILAERENWRDLFTVWYEGEISVTHATAEVLEAVAGLTPAQARAFLEFRAGPDGLEGTKDDRTFRDMAEVTTLVNANGLQAERLGKYFGTGDGVRRVESTGWSGGASYRISVVVTEGGGDGNFLLWEER
jgi:type II secretory pathway component PulK